MLVSDHPIERGKILITTPGAEETLELARNDSKIKIAFIGAALVCTLVRVVSLLVCTICCRKGTRWVKNEITKLKTPLSKEKCTRMIALLEVWPLKQSLISHLHHACKIASQGRAFPRKIINHLCAFWRNGHPIKLNRENYSGLRWSELIPFPNMGSHSRPQGFQVSSVAAGSLNYGPCLPLPTDEQFLMHFQYIFGQLCRYLWFSSCGRIHCQLRFRPGNSSISPRSQVDCIMKPSCRKIRIKYSKNDPFHSGCDIYLEKGNPEICPLTAIGS